MNNPMTQSPFAVTRVGGALGAEIGNIDLATHLSEQDVETIRSLLHEHKVLVFRDQDITPEQQVAFAKRFGSLEQHEVMARDENVRELLLLEADAEKRLTGNVFHADGTHRKMPPFGSVLRCLEIPEGGGDTIFCNMAYAYKDLSEHVKTEIQGLKAMHDFMFNYIRRVPIEKRQALIEANPPFEHPVVVKHPFTGEEILYVNVLFTTHFTNFNEIHPTGLDFDRRLSQWKLFIHLLERPAKPECQFRLKWKKHTIAMWDNFATQHYAVEDYAPQPRKMRRVSIAGQWQPSVRGE